MSALTIHARRLRTVLTMVFLVALISLVAERLGYAGLYRGAASLESLGIQCLLALPAFAYLAALWQFRRLADRVAKGEQFALRAAKALRAAGLLLALGAATTLIVAGPMHKLVGLDRPRLIDLDVSTLIIGAIGLALFLVARLIDRARDVQSELDEIF